MLLGTVVERELELERGVRARENEPERGSDPSSLELLDSDGDGVCCSLSRCE